MTHPRIGLALGGGGARGFGHVMVLEALDELGLEVHAIAGTSIGAILGAARATGLTGRDIREASIETFRDNKAAIGRLWELRPRRFLDMFSSRIGQLDPERVLDAFVPAIPPDFSDLKLPMTVVATDYYGACGVAIRDGNLRQAVAASMALPSIFRPVLANGRVLMDGGIVNPVPVDQLWPQVDLTIAVDVVALPEPAGDRPLPGTLEAIAGATQLLMASIAEAKFQISSPDVLIRPPVGRFHVLDFLKVREILEACEPAKDEVKRRVSRVLEANTVRPLPASGRA